MIAYLLLFMLMSPQPQPYCGKIVVQRYWIDDVLALGKNGHELHEIEPPILTKEKAKEIAMEVVGKLARKLGCLEPKLEECKREVSSKQELAIRGGETWRVSFSLWYKGIRIDDGMGVAVTRRKVFPWYGCFYKVIHDDKCKSCKRISKSEAEKILWGSVKLSDDAKAKLIPPELVWNYNCYRPNEKNVLMPYWKDMQAEWEGGIPDMIFYCDGSVIPEFVN